MFATVPLPTAGCTNNPPSSVIGLGEVSDGTFYVATDRGCVYRRAPGAGLEALIQVLNGGSPEVFVGFYVSPTGALYATSTLTVFRCTTGCNLQVNWTTFSTETSGELAASMCGTSDTNVWVFVNRGSFGSGVAYRVGTSRLDPSVPLSVNRVRGCWASGPDLYVAATDTVAHFDGLGFSIEAATRVSDTFPWSGGGTVNGQQVLAGSFNSKGALATRTGTSWSISFEAAESSSLRTVVGVSATEAYAFGAAGQLAYRWDGVRWLALDPDVPGLARATSSLLTRDGVVWVGGDDSNSRPVLLRGVRN